MSDVNLTVVGHVGTDPALATSVNGTEWCTFRLASTRRVRDPRTGDWTDGDTLWFTVKQFREKARHVNLSLRKGDPVVVVGRLVLEEWDAERAHELPDGSSVTITERRTRQAIDAQHVGVDATRGVVRFGRLAPDRPSEPAGPGPVDTVGPEDPWSREAVPGVAPSPGPDGDQDQDHDQDERTVVVG